MKYQIIIKTSVRDRPRDHEMSAAILLAGHFRSDVVFLRSGSQKTPDLQVGDEKWEIKSPLGNGKKTMENNLRAARKQSKNIVIDLSRCKMNYYKAVSRINFYLKTEAHHIKHLKIITKSRKVIDIT
ncbi:MAG: hypothetical protein LBC95_02460 [Candidatus Nomurabacteria bacterium]|jgi:hypothetical protein|nr:hypothetical protein [Candidatus Nomurabacteria bacterium]